MTEQTQLEKVVRNPLTGHFMPGTVQGPGSTYVSWLKKIRRGLEVECPDDKLHKILRELVSHAEAPPLVEKLTATGESYEVPDYWLQLAAQKELFDRMAGKAIQPTVELDAAEAGLSEAPPKIFFDWLRGQMEAWKQAQQPPTP